MALAPKPILELRPDPRDLAALDAALAEYPREIPKVLYRALNAGIRTIRTQAAKVARKELGVKSSLLKRRLWEHKASAKQLRAVLIGGSVGWPVGAVATRYRPTATGVEVRIGRHRLHVEGGFEATMPTGYTSAWTRRGRARLPLREARTDSVTEVIERAAALPAITQAGRESMSKRIARETERALERIHRRHSRGASR